MDRRWDEGVGRRTRYEIRSWRAGLCAGREMQVELLLADDAAAFAQRFGAPFILAAA